MILVFIYHPLKANETPAESNVGKHTDGLGANWNPEALNFLNRTLILKWGILTQD